MTVSNRTGCSADKSVWDLRVESASASLIYGDDFYACNMVYSHYVVSAGLDNLRAALRPLAR